MLHPKFGQALRVAYYPALVFGLMGTTLHIRGNSRLIRVEKASWIYLAYSLVISGGLLLDTYFMVPKAILDGYIHHNIVLQWNFFLMLGMRIVAIVCSYGLVQQDLEKLQLSLTSLFWRQTIVVYGALLCSGVVQYQLLSVINRQSLTALCARLSQILHVLAVKMTFYALLLMLDHQF
ncbi:putative gustatory receptor 58b [Drosophila miranda]|uniref:putative gustatory receptor 58b n=1 Tax=Drosophila miranda TaxID=7229 RepID=UPI00143F7423|nr:putative gustatory receptor 58b [Drosophila miranda]